MENLSKKYKTIWEKCLPVFKGARDGDMEHATEVTKFILEYSKDADIDLDVLIPVAMMHDIGHSMILPEHFKYITGGHKVVNGKLVHMLVGAKIAKDILKSCDYDTEKTREIVNIISIHDGDQIKDWNIKDIYTTDTMKVFHDIDCLDRYNSERIEKFKKMFDNDMDMIWI